MTYSFTKPRIKPPFSLFAHVWFLFYAFTLVLIMGLYFFVLSSSLIMNVQLESERTRANSMNAKIKENNAVFELLSTRKNLALQLIGEGGNNEKTHLMIKNIFDFVIHSGGVQLESVIIDHNSLELRGISPTKEMYILLIQTPLRSIFNESEVNFYPLANGWFKFVNLNKSTNEEEL